MSVPSHRSDAAAYRDIVQMRIDAAFSDVSWVKKWTARVANRRSDVGCPRMRSDWSRVIRVAPDWLETVSERGLDLGAEFMPLAVRPRECARRDVDLWDATYLGLVKTLGRPPGEGPAPWSRFAMGVRIGVVAQTSDRLDLGCWNEPLGAIRRAVRDRGRKLAAMRRSALAEAERMNMLELELQAAIDRLLRDNEDARLDEDAFREWLTPTDIAIARRLSPGAGLALGAVANLLIERAMAGSADNAKEILSSLEHARAARQREAIISDADLSGSDMDALAGIGMPHATS